MSFTLKIVLAVLGVLGAAVVLTSFERPPVNVVQVGHRVNLESDLIGKYVERLLQERGNVAPKPTPVIDRDYLQKRGLL